MGTLFLDSDEFPDHVPIPTIGARRLTVGAASEALAASGYATLIVAVGLLPLCPLINDEPHPLHGESDDFASRFYEETETIAASSSASGFRPTVRVSSPAPMRIRAWLAVPARHAANAHQARGSSALGRRVDSERAKVKLAATKVHRPSRVAIWTARRRL